MTIAKSNPRSEKLKRHLLFFASGCLLQITSACVREKSGEWLGTQIDSAGVVLMQNTVEGIWLDSERWHLEEELRFGSLDGELEYQFGQIGHIAVGSNGDIYVFDTQAQHVRVFTENGEYNRTVGGPGNGPGEIGRTRGFLSVAEGDTLLVPDRANRRINRYAADGIPLSSAPLRPEEGQQLRYEISPNGVMVAQIRRHLPEQRDFLVAFGSAGLPTDTLLSFPSGGLNRVEGELQYFSPEPMWSVTGSLTSVYGINNEYRIGIYDRWGALRRVFTKPFVPQPVTDRDLRAFFAYLDRAWLDAGVAPSRLPELHSRVHFASVYPAYYDIRVGYKGSIWIQKIRPPGRLSDEEIERYNFVEQFGSREFDVFDSDGKFLGVVEMPERFQIRLFRGDKIYGVWRDDLDVQHVMRLRILTE